MKIINCKLIFLLLMLPIYPKAYADGNRVLKQCQIAESFMDTKQTLNAEDVYHVGYCTGLVQGVRNTIVLLQSQSSFKLCFPENGISNEQAIRIFVKYLKNNPENLHLDEVELASVAFMEAYKCK